MKAVCVDTALLRGAVVVLGGISFATAALSAQSPRITPPPACVVPAGVEVGFSARVPGDRRPSLLVEAFNVTSVERGSLHMPWALTARLRERLGRSSGISVASEGSVERAMSKSAGNSDSAAKLLGVNWIIRGSARAVPLATELTVLLLRVGSDAPVLRGTYRLTPRSLGNVEDAVVNSVVRMLVAPDAVAPTPPAGMPGNATAGERLALAEYLLRSVDVAAADSARRVLEGVFAADTASPLLAVRLAEAYLQVVQRGGVSPPVRRGDALRRAEELAKYALARDDKRSDAWTALAVTARLRDTLDFSGARQAHQRAMALDPKDAAAIHESALTYIAVGDDARAATELRRALQVEPEQAASLSALAGIELRQGRFNQACAYSNAAIAAWMFDPEAYSVRAQARVRLGQARDAYADAETARRLSAEPWTQGLRLLIQMGAGNREGAQALSRTLVQRYLAPGVLLPANDASFLAKGFLSVGDERSAREALARATPRGRELATALRDSAFNSLRSDSLFRELTKLPR